MLTLRRQLELETIFLIAAVAGASLFFVIQKNSSRQSQFVFSENLPLMQSPIETVAPKITVSSQISSDGTKKVTMRGTERSDNTITYNFSTADESGANEKLIFTRVLDSSQKMTIPFNTWSPDNKYFFIQENAVTEAIFVFKADGELFLSGDQYLDATDSFKKANTGNNFDEATGWVSETLIIINTKKPDGEKGFSYWFEVPSRQIIQLATEF